MKLYGSLNNRLDEKVVRPYPTVGMGATEIAYSDRYAYTILEVSKEEVTTEIMVKLNNGQVETRIMTYPKWIKASRDIAKLTSGSVYEEAQRYEYTNDGNLEEAIKFIFHKETAQYRMETSKYIGGGEYKKTGRTNKNQQILAIGYRDEYYDPCF